MRSWRGRSLIIGQGLIAILLGLMLTGAAGLLFIRASDGQLLSVQTGSMEPVLYPGDAVLLEKMNGRQALLGSIISYRSPRSTKLTIMHRLVGVDLRNGWLTTKGDALDSPDPAFPPGQVIGQVAAVLPCLGVVLDDLRRPIILGIALYVPAGTVVVAEVRRLAKASSRSYYSLHDN